MRIKSILLVITGFFFLALGGIGILFPIMPTTPFVLVSAACFGSSSPKLYKKLQNAKYFGEFVENYKNKSGITKAVRLKSIAFLWISLGISAMIFSSALTIAILLAVGTAVTIHIATIKPKKQRTAIPE